jgi:hypothetical protein
MSTGEETKEQALPDEPEVVRSTPEYIPIRPIIKQALEKHRRDLPELLKTHRNQLVAYHGDERLGIGRSARKLYFQYVDRGLNPDDIIVLAVEAGMFDDWALDASELAQLIADEEARKQALPDEPELGWCSFADVPIAPMIKLALEKHRRDLPELLKTHRDQWVAYHGEKRLEFGRSKRKLYRKYRDRGLRRNELIVLGVEPELPDELDPSEWAHV